MRCPFCNEDIRSNIGLRSHIYWRHFRDYAIMVSLIIFLLTVLLSLFLIPYTDDIRYVWDKFRGKTPELYISLHAIYLVNNTQNLFLDDFNEIYFLNKFVEIGIIPEWHNQKRPNKIPFDDKLRNKDYCLLFGYDNANIITKDKEILNQLRNITNESRDVIFGIPSRELIMELENCNNCIAYQIFGLSRGTRDINNLNFRICFSDNYIIKVSEDLFKENDKCVRAKKVDIIEEEQFLGTIISANIKDPPYWNIWHEPISEINGKYISKGKEFPITDKVITKVVSGVIPNCQTSERIEGAICG